MSIKGKKKEKKRRKVFIICIKKFLSAVVTGSFQVSAGLSWMCEVSGVGGGTSSYMDSEGEQKEALLLPSLLVKQSQYSSVSSRSRRRRPPLWGGPRDGEDK